MAFNVANRSNKFNARKTAFGGVMYASMREAAYAQELTLRQRAGDIKSWRGQIPFVLEVNGKRICKIIPDFEITHTTGEKELVEIKGVETPTWRLKRKLFEALYPELWYTVVK